MTISNLVFGRLNYRKPPAPQGVDFAVLAALLHVNPILLGLLASLFAGSATSLGAIPVLFTRRISPRIHDGMLGFAAGVMLAATVFSLVVPAMAHAGGGLSGALVASVGLLLGGIFLDLIDRYSPHQHFIKGPEGGPATATLQRIWLAYHRHHHP